ncbi:hypothetical protein LUZ60_009655 [Juncus effusus]|nr:hypothetical protein LUZ60_009655 [Juncus effusus]
MPWQASLEKQWLTQPNNFPFNDSVPDSHAWSDLFVHPLADPTGPDSVPLIDLHDSNLIEKVGRACQEWGIFQITGHGMTHNFLNRLESETFRLFELPIEQKLKAAKSVGDVSGYGLVPISPFFSKFMWSEGFTIAESPVRHAQKLWPDDCGSFCDIMEEYKKKMEQLSTRLFNTMLLSLGLSQVETSQLNLFGETRAMSTSMHLNSYPPCPNPDRALGLAAHTDSGLLTLLYQNGISGLQVLRLKDDFGPTRWVNVPAMPNSLVVNIGDLMHILLNGRFRSVVHRAMVNQVHHRISVGYFCGPHADVRVVPLDRLVDSEKGPVYRAVTWPEYQKLRGKFFDKALDELKL